MQGNQHIYLITTRSAKALDPKTNWIASLRKAGHSDFRFIGWDENLNSCFAIDRLIYPHAVVALEKDPAIETYQFTTYLVLKDHQNAEAS